MHACMRLHTLPLILSEEGGGGGEIETTIPHHLFSFKSITPIINCFTIHLSRPPLAIILNIPFSQHLPGPPARTKNHGKSVDSKNVCLCVVWCYSVKVYWLSLRSTSYKPLGPLLCRANNWKILLHWLMPSNRISFTLRSRQSIPQNNTVLMVFEIVSKTATILIPERKKEAENIHLAHVLFPLLFPRRIHFPPGWPETLNICYLMFAFTLPSDRINGKVLNLLIWFIFRLLYQVEKLPHRFWFWASIRCGISKLNTKPNSTGRRRVIAVSFGLLSNSPDPFLRNSVNVTERNNF